MCWCRFIDCNKGTIGWGMLRTGKQFCVGTGSAHKLSVPSAGFCFKARTALQRVCFFFFAGGGESVKELHTPY